MLKKLLGALAALMIVAPAFAAEPELTPEQRAEIKRLQALEASLKPVKGVVAVPAAHAKLNLGEAYYFLGPEDAKKVLVDGWGNHPSAAEGVLGMIFPAGQTFLDENVWGAVVTYEETGLIKDHDSSKEDYDKVLAEMRDGEKEQNEARQKEGYAPVHLIGWAQPPSYDAARHDLIWARDLQFGEEQDHTLNYDVRHLGRKGVLSLNMISTMSQLPTIRTAAQTLAKTAEFDGGSKYADFKEGDAVAGYGLAGLVAAGAGLAVAKKAGLLAILLAFGKKAIVLIVAFFGGIVAWFRRRFGKKDDVSAANLQPAEPETTSEEPPPGG